MASQTASICFGCLGSEKQKTDCCLLCTALVLYAARTDSPVPPDRRGMDFPAATVHEITRTERPPVPPPRGVC
ncbi:MAG: hypothetical protein ABR589_03335 [Chthoniobacterales bacterium]